MKKFYFLLLLAGTFYSAQQNEIKVNLLKIADISYERKLMPQWSAGQHGGTGLIKDSDEYKNKIFLKTFTRWCPLNNANMSKIYFQLAYIHNEDIYCGNDTSSRNELNNAITSGLVYKFVVWKNWSVDMYFDLGRT